MTTDEIKQLVISYAEQHGINPSVALAQMARESGWRQDVIFGPFVGGAGERGISQFTPGTWARFGYGPHTNAYDPNLAMDAWGKYMTYLLNLFGWDYSKALTGYNGGEGHLTNPSRHGPPSQAALNYAREILANADQYSAPIDQTAQSVFTPVDQTVLKDEGVSAWVWIALAAIGIVVITRT